MIRGWKGLCTSRVDPPSSLERDEHPSIRQRTWAFVSLSLTVSLFYVLLRGWNYDGDALKYAVWNSNSAAVMDNNHPFSSHLFFGWWSVVKSFTINDFDNRMGWLSLLNSILGGLGAALVSEIILLRSKRISTAILSALLLSLTHAWFYHSTQVTEPMIAQVLMLASLRTLCIGRTWRSAIGGGVFWALSVTAYQSYVVAGIGLLVVSGSNRIRALTFLASAAIIGPSLYIIAALGHGADSVTDVTTYLFHSSGGTAWGSFRPFAVAQLVVGLANAVSPPWPTDNWPGLMKGIANLGMLRAASIIIQATLLFTLVSAIIFRRPSIRDTRLSWGIGAIALLGLFPPFYFAPSYNKLWLMPLSGLSILGGWWAAKASIAPAWQTIGLVALFSQNLAQVFLPLHSRDDRKHLASKALEGELHEHDLLVCDGWDDSLLYVVKHPDRPTSLLVHEDIGSLKAKIESTRALGGRVYFYGILELTEIHISQSFLNRSANTNLYTSLQSFREIAIPVWRGDAFGISGDLFVLNY